MPRPVRASKKAAEAAAYQHSDTDLAARPEIGTQAHFKKAKPPTTYRFDSALAPELNWDGQNPGREEAEQQLAVISDQLSVVQSGLAKLLKQTTDPKLRKLITDALNTDSLARAQSAVRTLKALSRPFLNWAGKAERLSFDVPTLPLFVHERLSTKAILETLKGHRRDKQDDFLDALYGFQERPLADQLLRAYEYRDDIE